MIMKSSSIHGLASVPRLLGLALLSLASAASLAASPSAPSSLHQFDISQYGAVGDGQALNTDAINRAIEACAKAGGGQVVIPPGQFLTGTIALRSHLTLVLSAGARLIGTTNLDQYARPAAPRGMLEAAWGKWNRGLVIGDHLEEVQILGPGVIDGNKVFDPTGEEKMRGPHTIALADCRHLVLRDVNIVDSANYAVFLQVCDDVEVRNVKITGGWDGIHWRGNPDRWCHNVQIIGCQFQTGDDALAGRYWDGTVISGCVINSSCNGLRLIGPATRLTVDNCLFYGPGLEPHRTSGERRRTNMLSGIILQPGAWDATRGLLDEVLLSRVTMKNVASPVTIWTKPGNPAGRITIENLDAVGVYRSALSIESWADSPITNLVLRGVRIEYAGGATADRGHQRVTGPGVDARQLPSWGLYARNIETLKLQDVRFDFAQVDFRPVLLADTVGKLELDNLRFPQVPTVSLPIITTNVAKVIWQGAPARPAGLP
jgi:hypothetical protein